MEQTEPDPIKQSVLSRANEGVNEAKQRCEDASEHLLHGDYLAAIGALAGLEERVRYVTIILTALREWEGIVKQDPLH